MSCLWVAAVSALTWVCLSPHCVCRWAQNPDSIFTVIKHEVKGKVKIPLLSSDTVQLFTTIAGP